MLLNIEAAKKSPGKMFSVEFCEIPSSTDYPIDHELAEPVSVKAEYSFTDGMLVIRGDFWAKLKVSCSRCLKDFIFEMEGDIQEEFAAELTDDISYLIEGDEITLDKMILDRILAELPQQFLCKEDCKGLCPVCGADRNLRSCGCNINDDLKTANPFAKLEGLFDNTEEV